MSKIATDLEQSRKLAKILAIDTADMHYVREVTDFRGNSVDGEWSQVKYGSPNSHYANYIVQNFTSYEVIPAWSLSSLLTIIMERLYDKGWHYFSLEVYFNGDYHIDSEVLTTKLHEDAIDACVEIIIKLKEKGYYDTRRKSRSL